jgi:hypothetical protein
VSAIVGRASDLGRRVAHRREELGLTRDEGARRAGMHSGYLDYCVLFTGRTRLVDDPPDLEHPAELEIEPWRDRRREAVIGVETAEITGRSIRQEGSA